MVSTTANGDVDPFNLGFRFRFKFRLCCCSAAVLLLICGCSTARHHKVFCTCDVLSRPVATHCQRHDELSSSIGGVRGVATSSKSTTSLSNGKPTPSCRLLHAAPGREYGMVGWMVGTLGSVSVSSSCDAGIPADFRAAISLAMDAIAAARSVTAVVCVLSCPCV